MVLLLLIGTFASAQEADWVLLDQGTSLHRAPDASAEAFTLEDGPVSVQLIGTSAEGWLAVRVGATAEGLCYPSARAGGAEVILHIRDTAPLPVVAAPYTATLPRKTGFSVLPGARVGPAGAARTLLEGTIEGLEVPEAFVGTRFRPQPGFAPPGETPFIPADGAELRVGASREVAQQWQADHTGALSVVGEQGRWSRVRYAEGCAEYLARISTEALKPTRPWRPWTQTSSFTLELSADSPLYWPDGSDAGEASKLFTASRDPEIIDDLRCYELYSALKSPDDQRALRLCVDPENLFE